MGVSREISFKSEHTRLSAKGAFLTIIINLRLTRLTKGTMSQSLHETLCELQFHTNTNTVGSYFKWTFLFLIKKDKTIQA